MLLGAELALVRTYGGIVAAAAAGEQQRDERREQEAPHPRGYEPAARWLRLEAQAAPSMVSTVRLPLV